MSQEIDSLLAGFSGSARKSGALLERELTENPREFQKSAVRYLTGSGNKPAERIVVFLLEKHGLILPMLLDGVIASVEQAADVSRAVKRHVDNIDVELARALRQAERPHKRRILRLLAATAENNRTLPLLARILREEGPELRSEAARVFAQHCQNSLFAEHAMEDPEPSVRASALEGLGLSSTAPSEKILQLARADPDPRVQANALLASYRQGAADAGELMKLMCRTSNYEFRSWGAWALGQTKSDEFRETLRRMATDHSPAVRTAAREALTAMDAAPQALEPADVPAPGQAPGAMSGVLTLEASVAYSQADGLRSLSFVIADGRGDPYSNLTHQAFRFREGGHEVSEFQMSSPNTRGPRTLAYVLDCSGSMSAVKVQEMNAAVIRSLQDKLGDERVGVYKFSMEVERSTPFSTEMRRLEAVIRRKHRGPKTASRFHDTVALAIEDLLREGRAGALVAVADGGDRGSDLGAARLARLAGEKGIGVNIIAFAAGTRADPLEKLARETGGFFLTADDGRSLTAACCSMLRWLRHRYLVRYRSDRQPGSIEIVLSTPAGEVVLPVEKALGSGPRTLVA